jgi:iron complex transport system substrate-binding protein
VRIASLVPSATEALFALGLGDDVVAVTHECDHPPAATRLPTLTRSAIAEGLAPAEVDAAVRELTGRGSALYELDEPTLAGLDVDLIVTQALCAVCAVSYDDVRAVAERLPSRPRVISLDPETLAEVLADLETLAGATGVPEAGVELRRGLRARLDAVREAIAAPGPAGNEGITDADRPRVVALEWLDPPFVGGHWVPEMIELAGGRDPLGRPGSRSRTASWGELAAAEPDVVVSMPCGLYADEAREQTLARAHEVAALGADRVFAVDAAGSFSRPGPRLVEGTELLAHLLHPDRLAAPEGLRWHPRRAPLRGSRGRRPPAARPPRRAPRVARRSGARTRAR